jgi:hypothetical protein
MNKFVDYHIRRVFFVKEKIGLAKTGNRFKSQLHCKTRILLTGIFGCL